MSRSATPPILLKGQPVKLINLLAAIAAAIAISAPSGAFATSHTATTQNPSASMSEGEVRKIDKEQGKVTLRHGPIQSLDMPGMTMVFKVADPTLLESVKEGDRVEFAVERLDGSITVTAIRAVR